MTGEISAARANWEGLGVFWLSSTSLKCLDPVPAWPLTPNRRHPRTWTAAPFLSMETAHRRLLIAVSAQWEWQHDWIWTSWLAASLPLMRGSLFLGHGGDAVVMTTHLLQDGGELVEVSMWEVLSFPQVQNHSGRTRLSRKVVEIPVGQVRGSLEVGGRNKIYHYIVLCAENSTILFHFNVVKCIFLHNAVKS